MNEFSIDPNANTMSHGSVQWPLPESLIRLLIAGSSDVTPTPVIPTPPSPPPTSDPSLATRTPTLRAPLPGTIGDSEAFFDHPEGELPWNGPDDRVLTRGRDHCEAPPDILEEYGIPALVVVDGNAGFWFTRIVSRQDRWGWTGYYHGKWQIWQDSNVQVVYLNARVVFLVYDGEERIAFEYEAYACV